jgi:hypothetical protein
MTEEFDPAFEVLPTAPKSRHGKLIGSVAAVVVLAGGGAATYVAFSSADGGSGSAKAAVQKVVGDLEKADLVGVLDDLVPGERAALAGPFSSEIASLKRLQVLNSTADPSSVSGVQFAAHGLVYADQTVTINDHVQIVKITGGTIDVSANIAKMPFTARFLGLVKSTAPTTSQHSDLAGKDVRLAAEKVGGRWYASLFYTSADQAAKHAIPSSSDLVPATGADSPDGAVRLTVRALLAGDARSALALVSPAELGAVHDYGGMILRAIPKWGPVPVTIKTLDLTTTPISDGGVQVGLKKLVLSMQGQDFTIVVAKGCVQVSSPSMNKTVCPSDAADLIGGVVGAITCIGTQLGSGGGLPGGISSGGILYGGGSSSGSSSSGSSSSGSSSSGSSSSGSSSSGSGSDSAVPSECTPKSRFTKAQKQAMTDLLSGASTIGIDTAEVGGRWFVAPVRTLSERGASLLSGLRGDDLFQLATLGK